MPLKKTKNYKNMFVFTLCSGLTMEVSGNSDLPLQSVDFRVNGDPRVVSHPKCLYHSLLQSLGHILFCYMFNTQVWKAGKKTQPNKKTNILDSIKYVLFMFCLVFYACMYIYLTVESLGCMSATQIPLSHCFPTRLWA